MRRRREVRAIRQRSSKHASLLLLDSLSGNLLYVLKLFVDLSVCLKCLLPFWFNNRRRVKGKPRLITGNKIFLGLLIGCSSIMRVLGEKATSH